MKPLPVHENHPLKMEGGNTRDLGEVNLRHFILSTAEGWRHGKRDEGNLLSETWRAERDFCRCKKPTAGLESK